MYRDIPLITTPVEINKKTTPKSSPYKFMFGTHQCKNHHTTEPQIVFNSVSVLTHVTAFDIPHDEK